MSEELKPCLVCAGKVEWCGNNLGVDCTGCHVITCLGCGTTFDLGATDEVNMCETLDELRAKIAAVWNKRTEGSTVLQASPASGLSDDEIEAAWQAMMQDRPQGASVFETRRLFVRAIESRVAGKDALATLMEYEFMESVATFRAAFVMAVGDKSPFAKQALSVIDAAIDSRRAL